MLIEIGFRALYSKYLPIVREPALAGEEEAGLQTSMKIPNSITTINRGPQQGANIGQSSAPPKESQDGMVALKRCVAGAFGGRSVHSAFLTYCPAYQRGPPLSPFG